MTTINKLIKGAFLGTVGLVGSVIFFSKYKAKPTNQEVPAFSLSLHRTFSHIVVVWQ